MSNAQLVDYWVATLILTKGVTYWQLSVIEPENRKSRIIEEMNKLFPEITIDGFFDLIHKVKIQ